MPAASREVIEDCLAMIDALQAPIDRLDVEVREHAKADARVKVLTRLPGVGEVTALVILAEIGDVDRFGSAPSWPPGRGSPRRCAARTSPSGTATSPSRARPGPSTDSDSSPGLDCTAVVARPAFTPWTAPAAYRRDGIDRVELPGLSRNLSRHRAAMRRDETPGTQRHVTDLTGSMAGPGHDRAYSRTLSGERGLSRRFGLGHVWRFARPSI